MNVGVVGLGSMGRNHVRVYSELKEIDKIYAFDVDNNTLLKLKENYGEYLVICKSIDDLLDKVVGLSICVPTEHHFKIAQIAIQKGVNFLVEKPVTLTLREGEKLLEYINGNLVTGVGHIERFNPIMKEIKNMIKEPKYIEIRRHNPASARINDADVVFDLMIHDIDIIWNYFMNGVAYELYSFWENDLCEIIARFDNCQVSLSASRIACKKIRAMYIEDEELSIDGNFMNQEIYVHRKPQKYGVNNSRYEQENIIEKVLVNKVEPLKEELKTFINCIKNCKQFPISIEQAVMNLRIAEEIKVKGKKRRGYNVLQTSVGSC